MSLYTDYLKEIEARKEQDLHPKPIDDGALVAELIEQIKDSDNAHRETSFSSSSTTPCPAPPARPASRRPFSRRSSWARQWLRKSPLILPLSCCRT